MPSLTDLPAEVTAMLAAADYEFHASIDITLGTGTVVHIATSDIDDVATDDFGTIDYVGDLREASQLNESMTLSVNRLDLRAQNVDGQLGKLVSNARALDGATGILSYIFINDAGNPFQVEILHGEISNSERKGPDIGFQLLSHLSSDGPVGGFRTLQNSCFNRFVIDPRCGSLSPVGPGCSKLKTGPNGCATKLPAARITMPVSTTNEASFTGFLYQVKPLPGTPPAGPTGVVDGNGDFTNYFKARESLGGYTGRIEIPRYLLSP